MSMLPHAKEPFELNLLLSTHPAHYEHRKNSSWELLPSYGMLFLHGKKNTRILGGVLYSSAGSKKKNLQESLCLTCKTSLQES